MSARPTTSRRRPVVERRRHWRWVALLALLLVASYVFIRGDGGLRRLYQRWGELQEAEARTLRLEAETDSLRQVLWLLENDLDYVEKVAREEYGMSRSWERVYRLPQQIDQPEND
jgi:cell division protein FtsB